VSVIPLVTLGLVLVAADQVRASERFVGEREVELVHVVRIPLDDRPAAFSVVERRLGPTEHRIGPGTDPLAARPVLRLALGSPQPVVGRGVRLMQQLVVLLGGPLLLEQPPRVVVEVDAELPVV
jgi:hypothetical protein